MDSLTQMALGAAVGQLVAGRRLGRRAALIGAVCGTLPDLDVLVRYSDPVAQMTYHRSWSHSFFWLTLATPVLWLLARAVPWWREGGRPMLMAIWLSLVTHPVLDCFTIYGTQALVPFSDYPISIGSLFIIDPAFTLPLLIGLAGVLALPRSVTARRTLGAGLAFCGAYLLLSVSLQARMQQQAIASWPSADAPPRQVKATPTAFNILRWRLLALHGGQHCDQFVSIFTKASADGWRCHAQRRELAPALAGQWAYERLRWFTHGWYGVTVEDGDVIISDLRMGVENYYVFRFVVARYDGGRVSPVATRQLSPRRPDWDTLPRAFGHPNQP